MRAMLAALVAMVLTGSAWADPVGSPPQLAAGSGAYVGAGDGLSTFTVGTAINPGGGEFRIDAHGFFAGKLDTTCIAVSGKRAVLIGRLREPIEAFGQSWSYAGLYLEDNGDGP